MTTDADPSTAPPILQAAASTSRLLRCGQAVAFVGLWMAIGWLFHLDGNSYLLAGVPLVAAFQIFIRKQPLVALWVRDAERFRLRLWGIPLAMAFAVLPAIDLFQTVKSPAWPAHIPEILWLVCCVGGAFGLAFSLGHFTRETWKSLLICAATAGTIGCGIMIGGALVRSHFQHQAINLSREKIWEGVGSFLRYWPVCFMLEEVAFRGAIDSHVHHSEDKHPWLSALFVSWLWGIWHLPIVGASGVLQLITLVICLPPVMMVDGVFLSFGWRRSGNLAVPGSVHALIDGVRNALLH